MRKPQPTLDIWGQNNRAPDTPLNPDGDAPSSPTPRPRDWKSYQRSVMESYYVKDGVLRDSVLDALANFDTTGMTKYDKKLFRSFFSSRKEGLEKRNLNIRRLLSEGFRFVPRYPNRFMINRDGVVWSIYRNKESKISAIPSGYKTLIVMFSHPKRRSKTEYIHRLVAETFIPNPYGKETVNHKDGQKDNNNVENLEWATQSENNYHAVRTLGWERNTKGIDATRELHKKFSRDDVLEIRKCDTVKTAVQLIRAKGIECSEYTVWDCFTGRSYRDVN